MLINTTDIQNKSFKNLKYPIAACEESYGAQNVPVEIMNHQQVLKLRDFMCHKHIPNCSWRLKR